jgi:hypothetical protein
MRALAIAIVMVALIGGASHAEDRINAVIGDVAGGRGEQTRIRAHLTYVLRLLRTVPATAPRRAALDELERYIARGEFPRRTNDPYDGRRPRFIDDRGVHCAVGHLIASMGEPQLARQINAAHEYDYVREIDDPALVDWAARTGFTLDELAMIQPTYGEMPIDASRASYFVEHSKDSGTVKCARKYPPLAKVSLHLRGKDDRFTATTESKDPFARCLVEYFAKIDDHRDGRGRQVPIEQFDRDVTLELTPIATLFEKAIDYADVAHHCAPRPGPIAREAVIEIASGKEALTIKVTTTPSNAEIEECVVKDLMKRYADQFGPGVWSLHSTRTRPVPIKFSDEQLRKSLEYAGPQYMKDCAPAGLGRKLTITASAKIGDVDLAIALDGGDAPFKICVRDKLSKYLKTAYGGYRIKPDDTAEPYFRVDATVRVTVTVEAER